MSLNHMTWSRPMCEVSAKVIYSLKVFLKSDTLNPMNTWLCIILTPESDVISFSYVSVQHYDVSPFFPSISQ